MWSPTISPDELYHHQREGAKWGIMNGPPYPLGRDQLSSSEKKKGGWISKFAEGRKVAKRKKKQRKALEKARQTRKKNIDAKKKAEQDAEKQRQKEEYLEKEKDRILKSGSAAELQQLKGRVTNDELQTALTRLDKESQLDSWASKTAQRNGYEKFMAASKKAGEIATASKNFIDLYNRGAEVYNAFYGNKRQKSLPKI